MSEPFLFLFYIYIYIYIHVCCIAILLYTNDRSRDDMLRNVHVMCLFHGCAIFFFFLMYDIVWLNKSFYNDENVSVNCFVVSLQDLQHQVPGFMST